VLVTWRPGIQAFRVVKGGNSPDECEDAHRQWRQEGWGQAVRVGVADGATESMLAGLWAETLVETFCRRSRTDSAAVPFAADRQEWALKRDTYMQRRVARGNPPKWYEEEGLRRGAFAAFLGAVLTPRGLGWGSYTVQAVGDVCAFHLRGKRLLSSFPLTHSSEFGNQPALVASVASAGQDGAPALLTRRGGWRRGDAFIVASDAFSRWLLDAHERGAGQWATVLGISTASAFEDLVLASRREDGMRNDDVAFVRVIV
jgi:hypothetical protein